MYMAMHIRQAFATQSQHLARRGSCIKLYTSLSIKGWHLYRTSESSIGETYIYITIQIIALSLKGLMRYLFYEDNEVARHSTMRSVIASSGQYAS